MQIGEHRLEIVPDTEFWLDGGAMFGVVPRALWERVTLPDRRNRIRLTTNCVFIDTGKEKLLIDTGVGEKWSEKEIEIYGIKRKRAFAESLKAVTGCSPRDITIVANTHLHFDHSGGNTIKSSPPYEGGVDPDLSGDGVVLSSARPQFPNARYLVSENEYLEAENPHERERASYLKENWEPLRNSGQLELMADEFEAVPGLTFRTERGHSPTMQTWRLDAGGETVYGFADLIPTRHHLPLPWIMGYDLEPAHTLEYKKRILPLAARYNWLCHFYHDPEAPLARLREDNGRFLSEPVTQ